MSKKQKLKEQNSQLKFLTVAMVEEAAERLAAVVEATPLQRHARLSERYGAEVYVKREDLQVVRSFKIRGAFNKMVGLADDEKKAGVVCASAGNHAQGVAMSCALLQVQGVIFMPELTSRQKVNKVREFGGEYAEIRLLGTTFDDAYAAARAYEAESGAVFVHPFDDPLVMAGQGTVGKEIVDQLEGRADVVISSIGGGGLLSGVGSYVRSVWPDVQLVGVEPEGAPAMKRSLDVGEVVTLETIDTFVDGAAVRRAGEQTMEVLEELGVSVELIAEGQACMSMIELYQSEGIVVEPAGVLPVSVLEILKEEIRGKTVVCVISGGNNDLLRYPDILERSLLYQGRKHYFMIKFAQKPGELRKLLNEVLGPGDDIVRFEYVKKTNAERGPAFVGLELEKAADLTGLLERMDESGIDYEKVNAEGMLYRYLV